MGTDKKVSKMPNEILMLANSIQLKDFTIAQLAAMIRKDWVAATKQAELYLLAMEQITTIEDSYKGESGKHIVAYFLCNAVQWKGSLAHSIKTELQNRINKEEEKQWQRTKPDAK